MGVTATKFGGTDADNSIGAEGDLLVRNGTGQYVTSKELPGEYVITDPSGAIPLETILDYTGLRIEGSSVVRLQLDYTGLTALAAKLFTPDELSWLSIVCGQNNTAPRTLTLNIGDANRSLTLTGNPTLGDWFNQSVKDSDAVVFNRALIGSGTRDATLHVNQSSGKGQFTLEGTSINWNFYETDGAVDGKYWQWRVDGGRLTCRLVNDLFSTAAECLRIDRSATATTRVCFPAGNIVIGAVSSSGSGTFNLAIGGGTTSPALGAATADMVHYGAVDNGAGNREAQWQPEAGGIAAIGDNRLRMEERASVGVAGIDRQFATVRTTTATVTTVLTLTIAANTTYVIRAMYALRRTGGSAGTVDDGAKFVRELLVTTKAGVVTIEGSATPTADVNAPAYGGPTIDVSGSTVRFRSAGATNVNVAHCVDLLITRIES